jgi:peptide subunit release factor 1 (eRF1)
MTTEKNLGIWMDHSNAHLIELTVESIETKTIESKFTHQAKEQSLGKSENVMHNKEQHQQSEYYKQLGEVIKNYRDGILFGSTSRKPGYGIFCGQIIFSLNKNRNTAN